VYNLTKSIIDESQKITEIQFMVLYTLLPIFMEGSLGYKQPDLGTASKAHPEGHTVFVKLPTPAVVPIWKYKDVSIVNHFIGFGRA
jgi:hypothetical protein